MASGVSSRYVRSAALLAAAASPMALLVSPSETRAADGWPASVQASYDVNFNGINVGTYSFQSSQEGQSYKLNSSAKLSLLLGALHWTGNTQATGKLSGDQAKPKSFGFDYQAQSKKGSTQMAFADDTVTQVLHQPPAKFKEDVIPVEQQHLKGVLDPLSAVLAISRGLDGDPCARRIPIYDGHQRFDLVMSMKGQVRIDDGSKGAQPATGYACRVRYVPIAGYKPDDNTRYMAQNSGIEIILRPMPGAGIFIPHQITIPTIAGPASLVARRVQVTTSAHQQFALVND